MQRMLLSKKMFYPWRALRLYNFSIAQHLNTMQNTIPIPQTLFFTYPTVSDTTVVCWTFRFMQQNDT